MKFGNNMNHTTHPLATLDDANRTPLALQNESNAAYEALSEGAAVFNLSSRHISRFTGEHAAAALNGLITNDVLPMAAGRGVYAVALTPKGKVLADVVVLKTDAHSFLVETSAVAGAEWLAMVRKYVNPRLAKYIDESAAFIPMALYGPNAMRIIAKMAGASGGGAMVADALSDALQAWPDWAHANLKLGGADVRVIRAPYLGAVPGFLLLAEPGAHVVLHAGLKRAGAVDAAQDVWNVAAVEAGRPVYGYDMDAATIPQEANLDTWSAISFEKGCYTGQETVARVHFRGHVNKHLRGLRAAQAMSVGASVTDAQGKVIGDVRRSVVSPRLGAIAIAMLRREIDVGSEVIVTLAAAPGGDGVASSSSHPALVVGLPFPPRDGQTATEP